MNILFSDKHSEAQSSNTFTLWTHDHCVFSCSAPRLRPSTVCGMESAGSLRYREKSTTATTLDLLSHYNLRDMNFSGYVFNAFILSILFLNILLLLSSDLCCPEEEFIFCLHAGTLPWIWLWRSKPLLWCYTVANSQKESAAAPSVLVSVCTTVIVLTNDT